jgi:chaperonin GroEL (HSP60 family)
MLKMLLDPMGGIVLTNDGNAILREVFLIKIKYHRSMWHTQLPRV